MTLIQCRNNFFSLSPNYTAISSYPHDTHISTTKAVMERRVSNPLYFSFAITLRTPEPSPAPKVIGSVGGTTLPEIGYGLNEAYWGKGYASEALEGFIKLYWELFPDGYPALKQERDKHRLKATTNSGNEASRGVLAKAGFKEIGDVEVYDYTGVKKIVYDGWVIERPGREGTTGGNGW